MQSKRYIICGNAETDIPVQFVASSMHFHLYGLEDENKVTLQIDDIREPMFKEIPERFHDLLDIAAYVHCADQSLRRGQENVQTFGDNWRRHFYFVIPVRDMDFWKTEEVKQCLSTTLGFLSDDLYEFKFVKSKIETPLQGLFNFNKNGAMFGFPEQVIMFSGGLDSLGGAVEEIVNQKKRVVLVNHRSTQKLDKRYRKLKDIIAEKALDNPPVHVRVTVKKKKWMNKEYSQRSRSFLFVSIGATIAKMLGLNSLRFYENGVISLNLPICPQLVGSKASRTTHPRVISDFQHLLSHISNEEFVIENPFVWKTKGEVVDLIAKAGCQDMIGHAISCVHTWAMTKEHSHCGTCSQCIDRRFAVLSTNMQEYDPLERYKIDVFTESREKLKDINEDKTMYASYLERANQAAKFDSCMRFLARYGEVARALRYLNGDPGSVAQRIYDMYKRHSAEVNTVIDKMFSLHGKAIRERSLPVDSMMRVVYESNLPISVPVVPIKEYLPDNMFRRKGGAWQVRFKGQKEFTVLPWLGASYIHYLLTSPGEPRPAVDIVCRSAIDYCDYVISTNEAIEEGLQSAANPLLQSLGNISDWKAVNDYRKEARSLLVDIEEARRKNNNVLERQLENDIAMIVAKINEVVGIGGKLKQAKDKRKNIRDSFRNNVKRLIEKQIAETDPDLAKHFENSLLFGNNPSYVPKSPITWELQTVVNTPE